MSQNIICQFKRKLNLYNYRETVIRLKEALDGISVSNKSRNCLFNGAKKSLRSAFCEEKVLETLIEIMTIAWCRNPDLEHLPIAKAVCKVANVLLKSKSAMIKVLSYFTNCNIENKRGKRQYDLQSMVDTMYDVVCLDPADVVPFVMQIKIKEDWLDCSDEEDATALAELLLPLTCCVTTIW